MFTLHGAGKSEDDADGADVTNGADIKVTVVGNSLGAELIASAFVAGVHADYKAALLNLHNFAVFKGQAGITELSTENLLNGDETVSKLSESEFIKEILAAGIKCFFTDCRIKTDTAGNVEITGLGNGTRG